jgi:hypothetical protein
MKKTLFILLSIFLLLPACSKKESTRTSGTDTINNITYQSSTYYNFGFSFSRAKLVSTNDNPGPDISIYVVAATDTTSARLTLQSDNLNPSFYLVGEYSDENSARSAFDNLKTVSVTTWQDMADPINSNQVWIYRSGSEYYTKIRIVSTVNEMRDNKAYGECTFQWVYQPDGSSTFPGK